MNSVLVSPIDQAHFHSKQNKEFLNGALTSLPNPQSTQRHLEVFIGESPQMMRVYRDIKKVAGYDSTVYVFGESGTGKELVAQALHYSNHKRSGPLIDLNCAAIPHNLAESELFGHEKGAFTGATQTQPGKFELAHQGTLFLDEIGELSLDLQVKLLRAIQEKKIYRIGGHKPIHLDARIVVATNKNLVEEVAKGNFREDLFFRLNVFPIVLPPLRKRLGDIPLLAYHFLNQLAPSIPGFHSKAITYMENHLWPGNVRELIHLIERAVVRYEGSGPLSEELLLPSDMLGYESFEPISSTLQNKGCLQDQIEKVEIGMIKDALARHQWHKTNSAKELGITRKTLDRKILKYQLTK